MSRIDRQSPDTKEFETQMKSKKKKKQNEKQLKQRTRTARKRAAQAIAAGANVKGLLSKSHTKRLLHILTGQATLFHSPENEAYATVDCGRHKETHKISSASFEHWLRNEYYRRFKDAPGPNAVVNARLTMTARAMNSDTHPVYMRFAEHNEKIYVDLGNAAWEAIEIDGKGWKPVKHAPVKFVRPTEMLPLPAPERGGHLDDLRQFVNVASDDDFLLLKAWLLGAVRKSQHPILALCASSGSAKTTTARVCQRLIDPNTADVNGKPKNGQDLAVAANHRWVLTFDNLSAISRELSDDLCRLATGGTFSTRRLYTNSDESVLRTDRPCIITSITHVAQEPDLVERCITLDCPAIQPTHRRDEELFWKEFHTAHPKILGGLFDAVSTALRHRPSLNLQALPRLAAFARWVAAATSYLGCSPEQWLEIYEDNIDRAVDRRLEDCPVWTAVAALMANRIVWEGTAANLLKDLRRAHSKAAGHQKFPKAPNALSEKLTELAQEFERKHITMERKKAGRNRVRLITLRKHTEERVLSAHSGAASAGNQRVVRPFPSERNFCAGVLPTTCMANVNSHCSADVLAEE
jgi:hypothetical protein